MVTPPPYPTLCKRSGFRQQLTPGVQHKFCRGRKAACPSCDCGSASIGDQTKGGSTMKALAAGSIILILITCGWRERSFGQESSPPQGEFRIVDKDPNNWAWMTWNVFEHLVEVDKTGGLVPGLATGWRWLDGRPWKSHSAKGCDFITARSSMRPSSSSTGKRIPGHD